MAEIYVTSTADSGAGSLRAAIADANDGDVILFDPVVFPSGGTTAILLSSYLTVNKSISIYGGEFDEATGEYTSGASFTRYVKREVNGVRTEVAVTDENPALEGETVLFHVVNRVALDGQAVQAENAADDWSGWSGTRIMSVRLESGENPSVVLSGITFRNALSTTGELAPCAHISSAVEYRASLIDCAFIDCINVSGICAGVISRDQVRASISRCEFARLKSKTQGAAFESNNYSQNTFDGCTFDACTAANYGGAVYSVSNSQNTFDGCTFDACTAANSGGAVRSDSNSQNTFDGCTFDACTANSGGAVYSYSNSQNTFDGRCVIRNCEATIGSGFYDISLRWSDVAGVEFINCEYVAARTPEQQTIRYFTSTADSGEGSLRATVADAQQNDIIQPDPSVFTKGATVEIKLSSALVINKRLILQGAGRKIVLNGQGASRVLTMTGSDSALIASDIDFIGGYEPTTNAGALTASSAQGVTLIRCNIAGNYGFRVIHCGAVGGWRFISSVVQGNVGTAGTQYNCSIKTYNSTIVGNYVDGASVNFGTPALVNAIYANASDLPSAFGFVNAPPDALPLVDWDKDLWRDWDLSLTQESEYNHGAVPLSPVDYAICGNDSGYDILGLPFVAEGALGAYERYVVDYWLDRDLSAGDDAYFNDKDYWTTTRAGTTRPDLPLTGTLFIDKSVEWKDDLPNNCSILLGQNAEAEVEGDVDGAVIGLDSALAVNGTVEELMISRGASYSGAFPDVLKLAVGATFTVNASNRFDALTLCDGSTLTLADGIAVSAATATIGAATVETTGRAYLATDPSTDTSAATFSGVVDCDYGAGASNFVAGGSVVTWDADDPSISVLLEKQVDGEWKTIAQPTGTRYPVYLPGSSVSVRLFDGARFLTTVQTHLHAWLEYNPTITVATATAKPYDVVAQTAKKYKITKGLIMASQYYNRGEAPLFFARVEDSETSAIVPSSSVTAISYTAYKVTTSWSNEVRTPVEGHENVAIDPAAYLDELVDDDPRWTEDETGYNFVFEPDTTVNPIFPDGGRYVVVITIQFANANPAPISYEIEVK